VHFNIGDEVVVTGPTRCGSNAHIGKRFKITERDDIYFSTRDLPWFPWGSLELVPSLKVGDWVEIIGSPTYFSQFQEKNVFCITNGPHECQDILGFGGIRNCVDCYSGYETAFYTADNLRKLTPEEVAKHLAPPINTPQNQFNEKTDARLSAIEKRQEEARKYSDDLYSIPETLAERIYALQKRVAIIEQRLSSLERSQNGQSKYLVMKQWTAGP